MDEELKKILQEAKFEIDVLLITCKEAEINLPLTYPRAKAVRDKIVAYLEQHR